MEARRAHWGRLIGATAAIFAGAFILPRLADPPDLQENRVLAGAPEFPRTLRDLPAYRDALGAYVADRFPPRTWLIAALNTARLHIGASGSPRVVVGRDGWLFSDDGSHLGAARGEPRLSDAAAEAWLSGLAGRTEALRAEGRAYVAFSPPVKEAVYARFAPDWFVLDENRPAVTLSRLAEASSAGSVVYPHALIAHQADLGLTTYSRHDSHWTGPGAYLGYVAFMRELQRRGLADGPRPMDAFLRPDNRFSVAPPRDLALMLGVASFVEVDYPRLEDVAAAPGLRITYLSDRRDWTGPRLIETGQAGKPTLLMTVDSFSNAFLPFLYGHFGRIIVAHNQDGVWRRDLIDRYRPDIVAIEIVESGLVGAMAGAPEPSPAARARIRDVVAHRKRFAVVPRPTAYAGKRRLIVGGEGPDMLKGSSRPENIQGRPGDDTIQGRGGDDVLRGGRGRDRVDGGDGRDWIDGGRGEDILRGGRGADVFVSFMDAGDDEVLDFNAAEGDRVQIAVGSAYAVRQAGSDTVIELSGARLVLRGVRAADLPPGWIRNR